MPVGQNPEEGSTYDPSANHQPTNRLARQQTTIGHFIEDAEIPLHYLSLRVTMEHSLWETILPCIEDSAWYISYPHSGKLGNNEHYHIFLPGIGPADRERIRKRFKKLGYSGNQHISVKFMQNGLTQALSYGAKEKTKPITSGDLCQRWIDLAPEWVEHTTKKRRAVDDFVELNCKNLIKVCFDFHKSVKLVTTSLPKTMQVMLERGTYIMSPTLARQGAPIWMLEVFKESVEAGKLVWNYKIWQHGVFRDFASR